MYLRVEHDAFRHQWVDLKLTFTLHGYGCAGLIESCVLWFVKLAWAVRKSNVPVERLCFRIWISRGEIRLQLEFMVGPVFYAYCTVYLELVVLLAVSLSSYRASTYLVWLSCCGARSVQTHQNPAVVSSGLFWAQPHPHIPPRNAN